MEIVGKPTRRAICRGCGQPIHYTEWDDMPDGWAHDGPPISEFCLGSPVAEPEPGTEKEWQ